MRTLLQRLQIHLGEVFRPIRDVYRALVVGLSGPQRYGPLRPVCSSSSAGPRAAPPGPWCLGPPGARARGWQALGTWARRTPRLWHGDPCQVRQI